MEQTNPLSSSEIEDIRKINAQLNQIDNQRFLLVTASITLVGFFANASIPKKEFIEESSIKIASYNLALTIFFQLILLVFFSYHQILTRIYFILRNYLKAKNYSQFERDFTEFNRTPIAKYNMFSIGFGGFSKDILVVYLFLGLFISVFPYCIEIFLYSKSNFTLCNLIYRVLNVLLFALIMLYIRNLLASKKLEKKIYQKWAQLLE